MRPQIYLKDSHQGKRVFLFLKLVVEIYAR